MMIALTIIVGFLAGFIGFRLGHADGRSSESTEWSVVIDLCDHLRFVFRGRPLVRCTLEHRRIIHVRWDEMLRGQNDPQPDIRLAVEEFSERSLALGAPIRFVIDGDLSCDGCGLRIFIDKL